MTCKHCGSKIRYKDKYWYTVLDDAHKKKLGQWGAGDYSFLNKLCVRSVSNQPEFGDHEPTKESIVKRILDKI